MQTNTTSPHAGLTDEQDAPPETAFRQYEEETPESPAKLFKKYLDARNRFAKQRDEALEGFDNSVKPALKRAAREKFLGDLLEFIHEVGQFKVRTNAEHEFENVSFFLDRRVRGMVVESDLFESWLKQQIGQEIEDFFPWKRLRRAILVSALQNLTESY